MALVSVVLMRPPIGILGDEPLMLWAISAVE